MPTLYYGKGKAGIFPSHQLLVVLSEHLHQPGIITSDLQELIAKQYILFYSLIYVACSAEI